MKESLLTFGQKYEINPLQPQLPYPPQNAHFGFLKLAKQSWGLDVLQNHRNDICTGTISISWYHYLIRSPAMQSAWCAHGYCRSRENEGGALS